MKICLLGATGLAGQGIFHELKRFKSEVGEILTPTRGELDLLILEEVTEFLGRNKPEVVIMAAGKVGGIQYNLRNQLSQYTSNLRMNENVINGCANHSIQRLILLSSSCVYPTNVHIPMAESDVFKGLPEPSNEGYALAKSTAIRHLLLRRNVEQRDWSVLIPSNLYGPVSHFLSDDHVIPMLIKKFTSNDDMVELWGDGTPKRQFLHNSDLGSAIRFILENKISPSILNVAPIESTTIHDMAKILSEILGFKGQIKYDHSKPNGHPDKSISAANLRQLGWTSSVNLDSGLEELVGYLKTLKAI
jgi:GDP-L-fucose synthase